MPNGFVQVVEGWGVQLASSARPPAPEPTPPATLAPQTIRQFVAGQVVPHMATAARAKFVVG